jgi:hypothetical protein
MDARNAFVRLRHGKTDEMMVVARPAGTGVSRSQRTRTRGKVHRGCRPVIGGCDHTLITPHGSVGVVEWKRPAPIHLKSISYDCLGLVRVARNGFDSRYPVDWSIRPT